MTDALKEIERLWVGVNQAMTLLARDDQMNTDGYSRLAALLKNDIRPQGDEPWQIHPPSP